MTRQPTWRDIAKPIIAEVLRDTKGRPDIEIKAALREAYPFGERAYHPYKVWLDEVKKQRGLKKSKDIEPENQTKLKL